MNIYDVYDKDPETITEDERRALLAHYREQRIKFEELDAKGKTRDMNKTPKSKNKNAKEEDTEDLLNVKVLD